MIPKVSVIVPSYNHSQFLKLRIESILNQSYQDFEIIILDDCSIDNSKEIIEQYRNNPKVSNIIFNESNSGSTFRQWNKGIALSKGKYIWIAESDDYADPTFLERTERLLELDDGVNLCFTQSCRVDKTGKVIENCLDWYSSEFRFPFTLNGRDFIKKYLWDQNQIYNASAVVFKKKAYSTSNLTIETLKFVGDWLFYIQLIEAGKIAYIPEVLNYFRQHQTSVTSKYNNSVTHLYESYLILKYISTKKLYINREKYNIRLNYFAGLLLSKEMQTTTFIKLATFVLSFDYLLLVRLVFIKVKSTFKKTWIV